MEEVKQYRKFLTKILRSQTGWPVDGKNGTYTLTFLKRKMPKIKPPDGAVAIKLKGTFQLRRRLSGAEIDHKAIRAMICLLSYLERGDHKALGGSLGLRSGAFQLFKGLP